MEDEDDSPTRLSEEELYRYGNYAIGRSGFNPVVSLPDTIAESITVWTQRLEIVSIGLYLISSSLFYLNQTGLEIPFYLGALVILLRGFTIIFSHTVIAQTVEKSQLTREQPQLVGNGRAEVFDDVELRVSVKDNVLNVLLINHSLYTVSLRLHAYPKLGNINIQPDTFNVKIPTVHSITRRVAKSETSHTTQFPLELSDSISEGGHDEIIVEIFGSKGDDEREMGKPIDKREITVPIRITNEVEVIEELVEYEIISE